MRAAGYRVLVPGQGGHRLSDKPRGHGAGRVQQLSADVLGLQDALGIGRAHVAGHDWGAPGRVRRLAILNAPHPGQVPGADEAVMERVRARKLPAPSRAPGSQGSWKYRMCQLRSSWRG